MKRYIYIQCNEKADRGYNRAIEVYLLKRGGFPEFVHGHYALDSATWYGMRGEAIRIVNRIHGHKIDSNGGFVSNNIQIMSI